MYTRVLNSPEAHQLTDAGVMSVAHPCDACYLPKEGRSDTCYITDEPQEQAKEKEAVPSGHIVYDPIYRNDQTRPTPRDRQRSAGAQM